MAASILYHPAADPSTVLAEAVIGQAIADMQSTRRYEACAAAVWALDEGRRAYWLDLISYPGSRLECSLVMLARVTLAKYERKKERSA